MTTFSDSEALFSGLIQDAYQFSKSAESTRQEADYLEKLLAPPPGGKLLDVPCGTGRHSLELARRGYRMTGVEISAQALDEARKVSAEGATWQHGDMRHLDFENEFDGAYCFWESFGYFDDAGNEAFLRGIFWALKPGARFVMDTHLLETMLPHINARQWFFLGKDLIVLEGRRYDPATSIMHRQWMFIRPDRTETRSIPHRLYTYRELCRLLADIGFAEWQGLAFMTEKPFGIEADRLALVVRKPA